MYTRGADVYLCMLAAEQWRSHGGGRAPQPMCWPSLAPQLESAKEKKILSPNKDSPGITH